MACGASQKQKRHVKIWERNSVVEDTSYKRIVGSPILPAPIRTTPRKRGSFDDYNRIRNNCFSARGTEDIWVKQKESQGHLCHVGIG